MEKFHIKNKTLEIIKDIDANGNGYDIKNILIIIQKQFQYLPREAMYTVSEELGIPLAKLYGPAAFFEEFSFVPKGKFVIRVCNGTACNARKSEPVIERLYEILDISVDNNTTSDSLFTLEIVPCMGNCGLSPVLTVNGKYHGKMTTEKVDLLISELKNNEF